MQFVVIQRAAIIWRNTLKTPLELLTVDAGSGCEVIDEFCNYEVYESATSREKVQSEEVIVISGTLKISP